jgi:hypothetical protein
LSLILAPLLVPWDGYRTFLRKALQVATGLIFGLSVSIAVLAVRGEAGPYLDTIRSQVSYPARVLAALGYQPGVVGHLTIVSRLLRQDSLRTVLLAPVLVLLVVLVINAARGRSHLSSAPEGRQLEKTMIALIAFSGLAVVVTLALGALWDHGLEVIALPATIATCFLISSIESNPRQLRWRVGVALVTVVMCAIAFGGVTPDSSSGSPEASASLSDWWNVPASPGAAALNSEAARMRGFATMISYARLGQNYDDAHAAFLSRALHLSCSIFHEYPYSTNLQQALACIRNRRPMLVLVGPFFTTIHSSTSHQWDAFVTASNQLLQADYVLGLARADDGGRVAVWIRRADERRLS